MKTTFKSIVKEHMALAKEFILSIPDIQQRVISMREGVNKTITASMLIRLTQTPETPAELGLTLSCYSYLTKVFGADEQFQQKAVELVQKLLISNPEAYADAMEKSREEVDIDDVVGLENFLIKVLELSEERSVRKAAATILKERVLLRTQLAELYFDVLNGLPDEVFEEGEDIFRIICKDD